MRMVWQGRDREANRHRGDAERQRKADRPLARRVGNRDGDDGGNRGCPPGRFTVGVK